MPSTAMVVVGGGSGSRFGGDKLMAPVAGSPLVAHTVGLISSTVDHCVLVTRTDQLTKVEDLGLGVEVVAGGGTRTLSEMAGLAAVGDGYELVGIHDAARPLVSVELIAQLYRAAEETGGSAPVLEPPAMLVDRHKLQPIDRPVTVQTPQVFRGEELMIAYVRAAQAGFDGHDTVDVIHRFGELDIAAVPGDPENIKVTYPEDLELVRSRLEDPSHTAPR